MKLTMAFMSEPLVSLIVAKASKIIALYLIKTTRVHTTPHNMALIDRTNNDNNNNNNNKK